MEILHGWIFDVCLSGQNVVVRVVDNDERVHRLLDYFAPAFYIGGEPTECRAAASFILEQSWSVKISFVEQVDPALGQPVQLLQVEVENPNHFERILRNARQRRPKLDYLGADLSLSEMYVRARQFDPLRLCYVAVDQECHIMGIEPDVSETLPRQRPRRISPNLNLTRNNHHVNETTSRRHRVSH